MESDGESSEDVAIIREIYNGKNSYDNFVLELERALDMRCERIVIEPFKLADETSRWIGIGNCVHNTSVLAGFGSISSALIWPDKPYICCGLCLLSVFGTGLYTISWQFDPCCKYQVDRHSSYASHTSPSSPVVLVRRDDTKKKIFHWTVSLLAVSLCAWRLYRRFLL